VIGCEDGIDRLWDLDTFKPEGPALGTRRSILGVAFTPDGRSLVAVDQSGQSRTWATPVPLEEEDLDRVALQLQVRTGLRMESGTEVTLLKPEEWEQRRDELVRLEGSTARAWRFRVSEADFHHARAQDAEQAGNVFGTVWHLDRLIAQRPGDWLLHARRGKAHSAAGQFEQAAADYDQAQRRGAGEELVNWYQQRVAHCRPTKQFATALWYLDRVLPLRPGDWTVHRDRADVLADLGKREESEAALTRAVELGADFTVVLRLAEVFARRGQWERAAALLGEARQKGPAPLDLVHLQAMALLQAGDTAGYRRLCTGLLRAAAQAGLSPLSANTIAWTCTLGPGAVEDYGPAVTLAEQAVAAARGEARHLFLNTLGAVLYRAGRYQEALERLNEAVAAKEGTGVVQDWLFLAMVHHQLRKPGEAKKWLARAAPREGNDRFWEKAEVELLHREAETLILGKPEQGTKKD
jgi:tetratricopeptide (TPR) repeat protein